jgi:cellulose biosynthesis protein BcsQ
MSIRDVIDAIEDLAKEYYPIVGIISAVWAILFGHRRGLWSQIWQKLSEFWRTDVIELKKHNTVLEQKLSLVRGAFVDGNDLWLRGPIVKPDRYDTKIPQSIPILLIANLKGGVGKTTIAANLAAYFEIKKGERVLTIDLDHQGSLSSMLLPERSSQETPAQAVKTLIGGVATGHSAVYEAVFNSCPIRNTSRDSRVLDCDDSFADFETQLALKWLIGDTSGDIRYNLASALHCDEVQRKFQRVIIDAPPRITTGFINALCASTHLLVPFVLDRLSAERVEQTLHRIKRMKGQLFPHLELAGVVGTMKANKTRDLRDTERESIEAAKVGVFRSWGRRDYVLERALIPRTQAIADAAGHRIVYTEAIEIFDPLGDEIFGRTPGHKLPEIVDRTPGENRHASQLAGSPIAGL